MSCLGIGSEGIMLKVVGSKGTDVNASCCPLECAEDDIDRSQTSCGIWCWWLL